MTRDQHTAKLWRELRRSVPGSSEEKIVLMRLASLNICKMELSVGSKHAVKPLFHDSGSEIGAKRYHGKDKGKTDNREGI